MRQGRLIPQPDPRETDYLRSFLIYEDRLVLGFNKPSGLASQGGSGISRSLDDLLAALARPKRRRPVLVHRLDQGTSGVILAARTHSAAVFLSDAFASRAVCKTYLALVEGNLPVSQSGNIDQWLVRVDEGGRARMIMAKPDRKGAQAARTAWRILDRQDSYALMQITPETGRMHQIRAHLMSLGCPILGDSLYGHGSRTASRLMLHAASLEFPHPEGGNLSLKADLPEDFLFLAQQRGLHSGLK